MPTILGALCPLLLFKPVFVGPHTPCSHDSFFLVFYGHDPCLFLIVVLCFCSLFSSSYLNSNSILGTSCTNSSPLLPVCLLIRLKVYSQGANTRIMMTPLSIISSLLISISETQQINTSLSSTITARENMLHPAINPTTSSHNTHNINSFLVINSYNKYNNTVNIGVTEENLEILSWLSPLEPRIQHQYLRTHCADNMGEWLQQTDEFQRWYSRAQQERSDHSTLFCCGDSAVGKTYFR